ncbi:MAG TPA: hypothetical protein PK032_03375 [Candidatus Pacearchaeota archaeon]|nr:hypothetical protein [Candidatus Pacearchaeota archaeon]
MEIIKGGVVHVGITDAYHAFVGNLHPWLQTFINIVLMSLLVTLFFIFIWKLYHIISKKNLIELNLKQYNKARHPGFKKITGTILYFLEYIIIFPFFVIFWFSIFIIFVMLLSRELDFSTVLTISTIIIIVIRTTAYYKQALSRDISKLLPFTLLAVAITEKEFFNFESIFARAAELPLFFENILVYIGVIVAVEIILRLMDFILSLFKKDKDEEEELPVPKREEY